MKLIITENAHRKIMQWVNMANFEVSGLGLVKLIEGVPVVTDAFLLEQEISCADTELDANAIGKLEFEHRDSDGELRFWWHSHVKMGVFWSGTDMDTIRQLGKHGWFYHTVFNQKGEHLSAFSCKNELELLNSPIHFYDKVNTEFAQDDTGIAEFCKNEYEKKVRQKKSRGLSEMVIGGSPTKTGMGTISRDVRESVQLMEERWDFKINIWDLMDSGWSNADICKSWQRELKEFGLRIKDLRQEWVETCKNAGMTLPTVKGRVYLDG